MALMLLMVLTGLSGTMVSASPIATPSHGASPALSPAHSLVSPRSVSSSSSSPRPPALPVSQGTVPSSPGASPAAPPTTSAHPLAPGPGAAPTLPSVAPPLAGTRLPLVPGPSLATGLPTASLSPSSPASLPGTSLPRVSPGVTSPPTYETGSTISTVTSPEFSNSLNVAYDSANGLLYVVNTLSPGTVIVVSPTTDSVVYGPIPVGNEPIGITYDSANGDLYVGNYLSGSVSVISGSSNTVIATIGVGTNPRYPVLDNANGDLYVPNAGSGNVSVISGATNSVVATVTPTGTPIGGAYDPSNGDIYLGNAGGNNVSVISGATNKVVVSSIALPSGAGPWSLGYDPLNGDIYVGDTLISEVTVISGASNTVVTSISVGSNPRDILADPANGDVYVAQYLTPGVVSVISGATQAMVGPGVSVSGTAFGLALDPVTQDIYVAGGSVLSVISTQLALGPATPQLKGYDVWVNQPGTIGVGTRPFLPAYDPDNGYLYVPNTGGSNISVVDGTTGTSVGSITVGYSPYDTTYDSENGYVYSTNFGADNVSVINPATNTVAATITGITEPFSMALDPQNGYLFVTSMSGNTVYVINGATNSLVGTPIGVGSFPEGITYVGSTGNLYVANGGGTNLTVINGLSFHQVANIIVGTDPTWSSWDQYDGNLYVSVWGENNLSLINPTTNTVIANDPVGINPQGSTYVPTLGAVVVANVGSGNITVCTGPHCQSVAVGGQPRSVVFDQGNGELFVTDSFGSNLHTLASLQPSGVQGTSTLDYYQELFLSAPVLGEGTGALQLKVSVLPSGTAFFCLGSFGGFSNVFSVCYANGATGNYTVTFTLQDSLGNSVSSSLEVRVYSYATLGTYLGISPASVDLGQTVTLNASLANPGSGGDHYTWVGLPTGCVSQDSLVLTCTPTSAVGSPFTLTVKVMDSDGGGSQVPYSAYPLTVYPDPTMTAIAPSVPSADIGQTVMISGSPTGGTGVYTSFHWSASGLTCAPTTGTASTACTVVAAGGAIVSVTVTDSNGFTSIARIGSMATVPDPAVSVTAVTSQADVGDYILFQAHATSGTGTYVTYGWSLPVGLNCAPTTGSALSCNPTTAGIYSVSANVTDSNGGLSPTAWFSNFVVYTDPVPTSPVPTRTSADVGQNVTFTTSASGGTGVYTSFAWTTPAALNCASSTTPTITCTPIAPFTGGVVSVSVTDSDGHGSGLWSTTFTVYGTPSLSSVYSSVSWVDAGQTVSFNVTPSGGTGSYASYAWTASPGLGCPTSTTPTPYLYCTPLVPGRFNLSLTVLDSNGGVSSSTGITGFTVWSDPVVTGLSADRASVDVGQTVNFTATVSGGLPGYTYLWAQSSTNLGCTLGNTPTVLCTPTSAALNGTVSLYVTDSNGCHSGTSGGCTAARTYSAAYPVYPDPSTGTPSATLSAVDVGQSLTLSTAAHGGPGGFGYVWSGLPTGCGSVDAVAVTCTPTQAGQFTVTVTVTDGNGRSVTSNATGVTVSGRLALSSFTSGPLSLDLGQSLDFTVAVTGGSGGLVYTWSGLPAGCTSTLPNATCVPSAMGTGSVSVTVSDSNGGWITSPSLTYEVASAPTFVSFLGSPGTVDVGQTLTFSATVSGGTGTLTYVWNGLPSGCPSSNAPTLTCVPTAPGNLSVSVRVTDANGVQATSAVATSVVSAPLSGGTLALSSSGLDLGGSSILTATVNGGSGGLSYAWSGLPSGCLTIDIAQLTCTPSAAGESWVSVTVTDSNHATLRVGPVALLVSPALGAVTVTASASSVAVGATVVFTAEVSGGTAPLTYDWSGLPAGCTSANTASLVCAPTAKGSFTVSVTVKDGAGASQQASASALTVTSAPLSGSGSNSASSISPITWVLLLLVVVALLVGLVAILRTLGGKKGKEGSGGTSPVPPPTAQNPPPPSPGAQG